MKFCDFWFEIPSAFINLLKNSNFMSLEVEKYNLLFKTYKDFLSSYEKFSKEVSIFQNNKELSQSKNSIEIIQEIKRKIVNIQKEKADLICMNMKNLTGIIGKLMKEFEELNVYNLSQKDIVDLLSKIKLFLKLTRLLTDKANEEMKFAGFDNEKNLFLMIKVFSEKCQNVLMKLSQDFLNSLMSLNNNKSIGKESVIEKISKEKNKMEIEISSSMYNNALPVDDNFDLD